MRVTSVVAAMGDEAGALVPLKRAFLARAVTITRPGAILRVTNSSRVLLFGSAVYRSRGPHAAHFICIYIRKKGVVVPLPINQIRVWDSRVVVKTQALGQNTFPTNRVKTWVKPKGRIAAGCF